MAIVFHTIFRETYFTLKGLSCQQIPRRTIVHHARRGVGSFDQADVSSSSKIIVIDF